MSEFEKWKKQWQRTQDNGYSQQDIWDAAFAAGQAASAARIAELEAEVKALTSERDAFKEELFTDHLKETMNKCTELQVENFSLKADCKVMAVALLREHKEPTYGDLHAACTIAAKYKEEIATWYAEEGWLLDEDDVAYAIRQRGEK